MSEVHAWTRKLVYDRDDRTCQYCDYEFAEHEADAMTVDHIVPKADGGWNVASNLVTCCKPCNQLKADRDVFDFAPERAEEILRLAERRRVFSAIPVDVEETTALGVKIREAMGL